MYRRQLRACPRCRAAMGIRELVLEQRRVEVDLCEGCVAAFFEFADGAPPVLARALERWPAPPSGGQEDKADASDCAACGASMSRHKTLDGVWRCRRCGAVLADRVGLEQLSRVAVPRAPEGVPTSLEGWLDQLRDWFSS